MVEDLDYQFDSKIKRVIERNAEAHFSIFPLAPIPLIIKLGYLFGDKIHTEIYQKFREPDSWKWQKEEGSNEFKITTQELNDNTLENIVKKYVEMNVAHPFMEGNGRSTRIWLDLILKKNLKKCTDWSKIDKKEYLTAMQESPVDSSHIYELIKSALTDDINNREIFMKGIDYSYYYEQID